LLNKSSEQFGIHPGGDFESFIEVYAGNAIWGNKSRTALQSLNLEFFSDIAPASNLVYRDDEDYQSCLRGLHVLEELALCQRTIEYREPGLVSSVAQIFQENRPVPDINSEVAVEQYNIVEEIDSAKAHCEDLRSKLAP
jgi:hypothetical protein